MKIRPAFSEPFVFWLAEQFLPVDYSDENTKPISKKEFYITLVMICLGLLTLKIVFAH